MENQVPAPAATASKGSAPSSPGGPSAGVVLRTRGGREAVSDHRFS